MINRQEGQVLPLGLALLVFGVLGAFVLFNTGQVATDKMKLANAADAAVYSGTLWQARALNFQSYTNRAMVANQVSIAQAVTLQSWVAYGAVTSENLATVLQPVPVINVVADGLQRGLDVVERIVTPIAQAMLTVVDVVNRGLSLAQEAMFVSTFVATPDVMRSVVTETDSRFTINTAFSGLGLANNLNQWRGFTEGYSRDDVQAMDERMKMINESRDHFTRKRNWKFFNFWFYSTPLLRHQIRREGTTRLIRVNTPEGIEWEWKAKDTMSLHNRLWHWRGTKRYEVPIGWAEAFANSQGSERTLEPGACTTVQEMRRRDCARFLGINRRSEYLADIGQRSVQGKETRIAMSNYTGVQAYRSLSQATIAEASPQISLKVEVSLPSSLVKGTDALGSGGQFAAPVTAPGERMTSVSVAEVFYKRPDADLSTHAGQTMEPANGYNPYWSSRLSAISDTDRLLAFSTRPSGGNTSTPNASNNGLPDTTVTLAGYSESDEGSTLTEANDDVSTLMAGSEGMDDFEVVAGMIDTSRLDQFREDIEEQLVNALRNQVTDMLAGAVSSSLGGSAQSLDELEDDLTEMAEDQLGDLVSSEAAQPFVDAITEATEIAEALEAEFRAIRQTIIDGFQIAYESLSEELRTEVEGLEAEIADYQGLIDANESVNDSINAYYLQIQLLEAQLVSARNDLKGELATALMTIVNQSTDLYVMSRREALYLVGEYLRSEEDEFTVPWMEVIEEDDTDG